MQMVGQAIQDVRINVGGMAMKNGNLSEEEQLFL